jgi:hypothetical protein
MTTWPMNGRGWELESGHAQCPCHPQPATKSLPLQPTAMTRTATQHTSFQTQVCWKPPLLLLCAMRVLRDALTTSY